MLQREIRLKEVQDATYDDMCRLLNERKLCNVERYAAEVSQYKGLSTLCKIYEIHPEVNLADVCKAQKINLGTALRFIAERGKLRDSDYVPEYDPTNNSTYQQRLADKYNNNLR